MIFETNKTYLDLITSGLSASTGVKLVAGKEWATNVKKKTLVYNLDSLKTLPPLAVKGVLLHEIGHLKYTAEVSPTSLQKKYPQMQDVYNAFEDLRIEMALENEFGDFAKEVLGYAETIFSAKKIGENFSALPKYQQFILLCLIKGLLRPRIQAPYFQEFNDFFESNQYGYSWIETNLMIFDSEVKKRFFDKKNLPKIDNITRRCETAENVDEVRKIIDTDLYPIIKDYIENYQPPIKIKVAVAHNRLVGRGKAPAPTGMREELKSLSEEETKALIQPYVNTLASRLRDVLKEKESRRWQGSHYQGKLLSKNVFKVCFDETRVFSKQTNPDTPHYKIHFVLDASGSMIEGGSEKALNTFIGTCLLDAVAKELRFERNAYAFDENPYRLAKLDEYRTMVGGGTYDTPILKMLLKDLKKEDDNLVFVFTDGWSSEGAEDDVQGLIKEIESKNASLVGICFGTEAQNQYLLQRYPNHLLLEKPEDLLYSLIEKLRKMIQR